MSTVTAPEQTTASPQSLQLLDPTPDYLGHKIRVLIDVEMNNAPWFVAVDVCRALELPGSARKHVGRLDQADLIVNSIDHYPFKTNKGPILVNEPGFYELVLGSRKPGAIAFKRWVCSDVLPSIRRTGQYQAYAGEDGNPIDIPDVLVEMVNLTKRIPNNGISEIVPRIHVWEYLLERNIEGLNKQQRACLGKVARRLLHTHGLTPMKSWIPMPKYKRVKSAYGNAGIYPEAILDMAYDEFLHGFRD